MKIEICEQMVQSWLINCKNCQVVQTNWSVSPLKDVDGHKKDINEYITYFVSALKNGVLSGEIDNGVFNTAEEDAIEFYKSLNYDGEEVSFMRVCQMLVAEREAAKDENGNIDFSKISILGRAGKARELQFVRQTEIDILGVELDNGQAKNIYLVDTAFHKDGLNYSDTVSSVTKKIIRAILVADIIFGTDIPVHIVFASPVCKSGPESKIKAIRKYVEPLIKKRPTLHGKPSQVCVELYLNQSFAEEIYLPLRKEIDKLYGGNDLFMRSLNLAKAAEGNLPESQKATASTGKKIKSPTSPATPSGGASGSSSAAKISVSGGANRRISDKTYEIAAYYLRHTEKMADVGTKFLPTPDPSGAKAKSRLKTVGILGEHKGMLSAFSSIDDAIASVTDAALKHTLEKIKELGL